MPEPYKPWVRDYIGIPFADEGYDRNGLNCWGLLFLVFKERWGLDAPTYEGYSSPHDTKTISVIMRHACDDATLWRRVPIGSEREYDVIVWRTLGRPTHVALVIGKNHMLHIQEGINSCVEEYRTRLWPEGRIHGIRRHVAIDSISAGAA